MSNINQILEQSPDLTPIVAKLMATTLECAGDHPLELNNVMEDTCELMLFGMASQVAQQKIEHGQDILPATLTRINKFKELLTKHKKGNSPSI